MKAIRTKEVNENVKAANSCLRKAKWQAKELAVFTGEVVRLMDKEGHSLQGFFNRKHSINSPFHSKNVILLL